MGAAFTTPSVYGEVQPGLDDVSMEDPIFKEIVARVRAQSEGYEQKYRYKMRVSKVSRVRECKLLQEHRREAEKLGAPTLLFHGTTPHAASSIAEHGFRMPNHAGMFGKGVYFASCPLKSANYAKEDSWGPTLWRLVTGGRWWERKSAQMFVCDVYLGKTMTLRTSSRKFDPEKDLKAGWLRKALGLGDYNSVHAPGGFFFCAVTVEEFIVYQVYQAIPRYLVEFEFERF